MFKQDRSLELWMIQWYWQNGIQVKEVPMSNYKEMKLYTEIHTESARRNDTIIHAEPSQMSREVVRRFFGWQQKQIRMSKTSFVRGSGWSTNLVFLSHTKPGCFVKIDEDDNAARNSNVDSRSDGEMFQRRPPQIARSTNKLHIHQSVQPHTQASMPQSSIVEEFKVPKCRLVMTLRDSKDAEVSEAGVQIRTDRKWSASQALQQAEGFSHILPEVYF